MSQPSHSLKPASENKPAPHNTQVLAYGESEKVPAAQGVHWLAPSPEKLPKAQDIHSPAAAAEKLPALQSEHALAIASE